MPFDSSIIFHCIDTTHFILPFMIWCAFGLFPLCNYERILLWTYFSKILWAYVFISPGYMPTSRIAESGGHSVFNFLITKLFSKLAVLYNIPNNNFWGFQFLYILTSAWYFVILVIAFLVHLKCYIIVIMICISLMTTWCWTSLHVLIGRILVYPLWRDVYPLPIFKLGCLFIQL